MRKCLAFALAIMTGLAPSTLAAQGWASGSAGQTVEEYLQTYFNLRMHSHESKAAFNTFNLITFYPTNSKSTAILFMIQAYNDNGAPADSPHARREIRVVADSTVSQFVSFFGLPDLNRRWRPSDPKSSFIIRHVRVTDLRETLAVTMDGATSFDPSDFSAGRARVVSAGGVWSW